MDDTQPPRGMMTSLLVGRKLSTAVRRFGRVLSLRWTRHRRCIVLTACRCCLQVDVFQMSVIEFHDRPGQPVFHLEHYIEGNYIKYNSNSGFVDEALRLTPQVRARVATSTAGGFFFRMKF